MLLGDLVGKFGKLPITKPFVVVMFEDAAWHDLSLAVAVAHKDRSVRKKDHRNAVYTQKRRVRIEIRLLEGVASWEGYYDIISHNYTYPEDPGS